MLATDSGLCLLDISNHRRAQTGQQTEYSTAGHVFFTELAPNLHQSWSQTGPELRQTRWRPGGPPTRIGRAPEVSAAQPLPTGTERVKTTACPAGLG